MSLDRRCFLAGVVGLTTLGAGCVGSPGGGSTSTTENKTSRPPTTTNEPTPTPGVSVEPSRTDTSTAWTQSTGSAGSVPVREPPACDGNLRRLSAFIDEVRYDSLGGFALTASEKAVVLGDEVTFHLENETASERVTGNSEQFDVQRRVESGWQSIYWVADGAGYTGEGISHRPGEGFTWQFTLTRDGLEHATRFNTPYSVCEDLSPGTYRFVYQAVSPTEEQKSNHEKEYAIGVRFTVESS